MALSQQDVLRSLLVGVFLTLDEKDPEADWETVGEYGKVDTRPAISYAGVLHPMLSGGLGTYLVPGVTVEGGAIESLNRDQFACDVIVSVGRLVGAVAGSLEVEQLRLGQLVSRLRDFVYRGFACPIYSFGNSSVPTGIVGYMNWAWQRWGDQAPSEEPVGRQEVGGWIRQEFRFRIHFTRL